MEAKSSFDEFGEILVPSLSNTRFATVSKIVEDDAVFLEEVQHWLGLVHCRAMR